MTTRRTLLALLAAAPLAATISTPAAAMEPQVFQRDGYAISGYDPVAYFTDGKPVIGDDAFTSEYQGATFRFASAESKAKFDANPAAYAPQYGGYCAYAVANGYTAKTEPDAWSIVDDKLYLNYSKSVRALWATRRRHNISEGDKNWPDVLG